MINLFKNSIKIVVHIVIKYDYLKPNKKIQKLKKLKIKNKNKSIKLPKISAIC